MNHYQVLGVKQTASQKEIKDAYKRLIKKYHPDIYKGDKSFAERKSQELNTAYDILSNPELKAAYDEELNPTPVYEYTPPKYDNPNNNYYSSYKNSNGYNKYNNRGSNYYSSIYSSAAYKKVNEMHNKFSNSVIESVTKMKLVQKAILVLTILLIYLVILISFFNQYNKLDFSRPSFSGERTSDNKYIRSTKDRASFSIYDLGFTEEDLYEVYLDEGYDKTISFDKFKVLLEDKLYEKLYGY